MGPRGRGAQTVGWGAGHQRPHVGLRVRMPPGFQQQGVGTIVKVVDKGLTQPSCRVRWDGGPTSTYHSGATVSRGALARSRHPEPAQVELRNWVKLQGWDMSMLASLTLGDVIDIDENGAYKMDIKGLRGFVGTRATEDQLADLRGAVSSILKVDRLRLDALRLGKLTLPDFLDVDERDGGFKIGVEEMREECPTSITDKEDGVPDKELQRQVDELRAFAYSMHAQSKEHLDQVRISTAGAGHDLSWQKVKGQPTGQPGMCLPLICATREAAGSSNLGEGARFIVGGGARGVSVQSRGDKDLLRAFPFTAGKLCGVHRAC